MSFCARYRSACTRLSHGFRAFHSGVGLRQTWSPISVKSTSLTSRIISQFNLHSRNLSTQSDESPSLVEVLKEEIQAETDLARKNMEGKEAPTIPGFTIKTDEAEVTLIKNHGDEKVTVTFNVNSSMESQEESQMMEESPPGTQEEHEMTSRPSFVVDIEKGGQKLSFECQPAYHDEENEDTMDVISVCIYGSNGKLEDKVYVAETASMDQNLYDPLVDYLAERGITDEFMKQLVDFSTHYEHAQYVNMLKKIQSFMDA